MRMICFGATFLLSVQAVSAKAQSVDMESPWSGLWVGATLGYGSINYDISGELGDGISETNLIAFDLPDAGGTGGLAGIELGYSLAFGGGWVGGVRLNHAITDITNDASLNVSEFDVLGIPEVSIDYELTQKSRSALIGQIGYVTSDSTMIYGLLGAARSSFKGETVLQAGGFMDLADITESYDFDIDGVTYGVGIETFLTDKLSLKFEYQITAFSDYDIGAAETQGVAASATMESQMQTAQATLAYRF